MCLGSHLFKSSCTLVSPVCIGVASPAAALNPSDTGKLENGSSKPTISCVTLVVLYKPLAHCVAKYIIPCSDISPPSFVTWSTIEL